MPHLHHIRLYKDGKDVEILEMKQNVLCFCNSMTVCLHLKRKSKKKSYLWLQYMSGCEYIYIQLYHNYRTQAEPRGEKNE